MALLSNTHEGREHGSIVPTKCAGSAPGGQGYMRACIVQTKSTCSAQRGQGNTWEHVLTQLSVHVMHKEGYTEHDSM